MRWGGYKLAFWHLPCRGVCVLKGAAAPRGTGNDEGFAKAGGELLWRNGVRIWGVGGEELLFLS